MTVHRNQTLLGSLDSNYQKLERHNIVHAYLNTQVDVKIPSLPAASLSDLNGYSFADLQHQRMSYYVFLDSLNLLRAQGAPITMNSWLNGNFMLVFKTSFELERYSDSFANKILSHPNTALNPTMLYLRFSEATTQTLRLTIMYRCLRRLQLNSNREGFLSHIIEQ